MTEVSEVVSKSGKQTEEKKVKSIDIVWFDKNDEEKDADFMVQILLTRQTFTLKTVFSFKNSIRDGTFKIPAYDEELSAAMIFQLFSLQIKEMIKQKMYIDPGEIDGQFDIKFVKNEFIPSLYWTISESSCKKTYNIPNNGNEKDLILQLLNEIEKLKTAGSPCVIYLYRKDIQYIETPLHIPFHISELESNPVLLKKFCSLNEPQKSEILSIQVMCKMKITTKDPIIDDCASPLIICYGDNNHIIIFEKHQFTVPNVQISLTTTQVGYLLSGVFFFIDDKNVKIKEHMIDASYSQSVVNINDIRKVFSKKNIILAYSAKLKNAKSYSFSVRFRFSGLPKQTQKNTEVYAFGMYKIIISAGYLCLQNDFFYRLVENKNKMEKTNVLTFGPNQSCNAMVNLFDINFCTRNYNPTKNGRFSPSFKLRNLSLFF